jgi:hypothetical protein
MGLTNSLLCMWDGAENEISAHNVSVKIWLHTYMYIWTPFSWIPRTLKEFKSGGHLDNKGTGLPWTGIRLWGTESPFLWPRCFRTIRVQTKMLIHQSINQSTNQNRNKCYIQSKNRHNSTEASPSNLQNTFIDCRKDNYSVCMRGWGRERQASGATQFELCVKNQQIHQLFIQFINYVW